MRSSFLRRCGPCTACCAALGDKAAERGAQGPQADCRSHDGLPPGRTAFECLWLGGLGTPGDRPDRTGVVLSAGRPGALGIVIQAHEVWAGAWDRSEGTRRLAAILARGHLVVLVRAPAQTIVGGPPFLVAQAARRGRWC